MNKIPEGAETVGGEGADLRAAVIAAAETLGVPPKQVGYTLDLSHFRSSTGGSMARSTVKVLAWALPEAPEEEELVEEKAPAASEAASTEEETSEEAAPEAKTEAAEPEMEGEVTEAAEFAQAWFLTLMGHMDVQAKVKATGDDEHVRIWVSADKAGRIIGRRGSTLGAIRHLLRLALTSFGDFIIDVDVDDDRKRDGGRGRDRDDRRGRGRERGERRDRGDRRERRGDRDDRRGRGRDRGDRGDRRRRGRDGGKGAYPEEKLQAIARRAADKARETGRAVTINLKLNSYDRRVIHVEVAEVDGVESQSVVKDDVKLVQVVPLLSQD